MISGFRPDTRDCRSKGPRARTSKMGKKERERTVAERVALDMRCSLVEMREAPDAELRDANGGVIGLEVVSVVDQDFLESRRRLVETTETLEALRASDGIQCYVTIGFDLAEFGLRQDYRSHTKWLNSLDVMRLVAEQPSGELDAEALRREGIERIAWLSWRPSSTPKVGWGYQRRTEAGHTLVDHCLAKKHGKLATYRERNSGAFDAFWLAIDSLGPGTMEDGGFTMLLDRRFETSFDKVFLMMRDPNGGFSVARDVTPSTSGSALKSP
jgi:hypothetical protein